MHRNAPVVTGAGVLAAIGLLMGLASEAAALPLISEALYDAVASDNGLSFVEIYGAPGSSLDGYTLEGVNGAGGGVGPVVALGGTIPADGIFVVADDVGDGTSLVQNADLIGRFDFQSDYQT